jgi:hypothetical protein
MAIGSQSAYHWIAVVVQISREEKVLLLIVAVLPMRVEQALNARLAWRRTLLRSSAATTNDNDKTFSRTAETKINSRIVSLTRVICHFFKNDLQTLRIYKAAINVDIEQCVQDKLCKGDLPVSVLSFPPCFRK